MMRRVLAIAIAIQTSSVSAVMCCPFCSAPSLTLSEQVAQSDAVVLVKWARGTKPTEESAGSTDYEVVDVTRTSGETISRETPIVLPRYRAGKDGDLFLLMGTLGRSLEWGSPIEVTDSGYQYIRESPSPRADPTERLTYYVRFLEHPDQLVSNDAYAEFANAPYKDITPLADSMPREKLRKWIVDPDTPVTRLGLYGLLLGLCGQEADAALMKSKILERSDDFRLGIDGVISGFLLLTGAEGLGVIDDSKLKNATWIDDQGNEKTVPFSETYAAMQALRFMWTYGEGRIEKERLRQSMRLLLDRPELADLVIADLARWKDWSVIDRLMKLYGAEEYDIPSIKRAIVRYLYYCSRDMPKDAEQAPEHTVLAKVRLVALEEQDPKTVKEAKRYLIP